MAAGAFGKASSQPCGSERREHDKKELRIIYSQGPPSGSLLPPARPNLLMIPKPAKILLAAGDQRKSFILIELSYLIFKMSFSKLRNYIFEN